MRFLYLIICLLVICTASDCMGAGLGPSRRILEGSPGQVIESFLYVSPDSFPQDILLAPQGPLSKNIEVEPGFTLRESDTRIDYQVRIPNDAPSGMSENEIRISFVDTEAGQISTQVTVIHQLWVNISKNQVTQTEDDAYQKNETIDTEQKESYEENIRLKPIFIVLLLITVLTLGLFLWMKRQQII